MATEKKQTVVIGAGPGGYVAAIRASQLGQKVTIIEKEYIGGTCLNVGCIPSKALVTAAHHFADAQNSEIFGVTAKNVTIDFEKTQQWKDNKVVKTLTKGVEGLLKKNKVEIIRGTAKFQGNKTLTVETEKGTQTIEFENAIVSTGSLPIELPELPFGDRVIDTTGALNIKAIPESLTVVGGGYVGTQLAGAFRNFGVKVTIIEKEDSIVPFFDQDMIKIVQDRFKKNGVEIHEAATIKSYEDTGSSVSVTFEVNGKEQTVTSDAVLVSAGRRPNTSKLGFDEIGVKLDENGFVEVNNKLQSSVEGIYAIGDITAGHTLAHKASHHGKVVAEILSGKDVTADYNTFPIAIYTEPGLATVGATLADAKNSGGKLKDSKFPLFGNGRALSLNDNEGFVRLITDAESGAVKGAQIVGTGAPDMIAELGFAIDQGMNAEDIALTIHAHPTLAESTMDAAELAMGLPIHI